MARHEGSVARKIERVPAEERAEYHEPRKVEKARRPKEEPEARVILSEEVRRESEEAQRRAEELRERLKPVPAEKLGKDSENAREHAQELLDDFREKLEARSMTEDAMDQYAKEFAAVRDRIEALQADSRRVPAGERIGNVVNANFKALEELEGAIRASKMEAMHARAEMRFGAGVRKAELEREGEAVEAGETADEIIARVKEKYGAHPEELMAGEGWNGVKFRLGNAWSNVKNTLARLANLPEQKSDYALYRQARATEERGEMTGALRGIHERRKRPSAAEREEKRKEEEEDSARRKKAVEKERVDNRELAARALTRERAARLWDEINDQMTLMRGEHPTGYSFTPEDYVVMAGRYVDAIENNRAGGIKEYKEALQNMNEELAFPKDYDPLVGASQSRLGTMRGKKSKDVLKGTTQRRETVARQERR